MLGSESFVWDNEHNHENNDKELLKNNNLKFNKYEEEFVDF